MQAETRQEGISNCLDTNEEESECRSYWGSDSGTQLVSLITNLAPFPRSFTPNYHSLFVIFYSRVSLRLNFGSVQWLSHWIFPMEFVHRQWNFKSSFLRSRYMENMPHHLWSIVTWPRMQSKHNSNGLFTRVIPLGWTLRLSHCVAQLYGNYSCRSTCLSHILRCMKLRLKLM